MAKGQREALFERLTTALRVVEPQLGKRGPMLPRQGPPLLHVTMQGQGFRSERFMHTDLSDGALRALCVLWYAATTDEDGVAGPLLIDQAECSLHPALIEHLPRLLADVSAEHPRQMLLASCATALVSGPDVEPREVIALIPSLSGTKAATASEIPAVASAMSSGAALAGCIDAHIQLSRYPWSGEPRPAPR